MRKMLIIAAAILAGAGSAVAGEDRHAAAQSQVGDTIRKGEYRLPGATR